ncbi:hypothetical protein ABZP36_001663 [Zizania latifolia]
MASVRDPSGARAPVHKPSGPWAPPLMGHDNDVPPNPTAEIPPRRLETPPANQNTTTRHAKPLCMEGILERYQRCSFEERAVLDPNTQDQANWSDEYGILKSRLDALQKSRRQLLGEQLDTLTTKELQQLEHQLDSSLKHIRSRKNQLLFDSISELQKKEKSLKNQNGILQKLMETEREKNIALTNTLQREEQNRAIASSSTPSPSPTLATVQDSIPALNISTYQPRGSGEPEAQPQPSLAQVNNSKLPPWMLRTVSNT